MIRRFPARCAATLLLALPAVCTAQAPATSACVDGERPTEPYSEHDKWGMQRYDAELQRYKRDHERYLHCMDRRQGKPEADSVEHKLQDAMQAPEQR